MSTLIVQTAPKGERDPARPNFSDAMRRMLPTVNLRRQVARSLGLSRHTVDKHCRYCADPRDSGKRNCLHWHALIQDFAFDDGVPLHDVMAGVEALANRYGFTLVPKGGQSSSDPEEIAAGLAEARGELLSSFIRAKADGVLDIRERGQLREMLRRDRAILVDFEFLTRTDGQAV